MEDNLFWSLQLNRILWDFTALNSVIIFAFLFFLFHRSLSQHPAFDSWGILGIFSCTLISAGYFAALNLAHGKVAIIHTWQIIIVFYNFPLHLCRFFPRPRTEPRKMFENEWSKMWKGPSVWSLPPLFSPPQPQMLNRESSLVSPDDTRHSSRSPGPLPQSIPNSQNMAVSIWTDERDGERKTVYYQRS